MINQKEFFNLLGQIRLYSLADFIILFVALSTSKYYLIGAIFLHIGFLLFLEKEHHHRYRKAFPKYSWVVTTLIGLIFLHNFAAFCFLFFSYLYSKKNISFIGVFSPFIRGLQSYFIAASIVGFSSSVAFLAFGLLTVRNFTGDLRDVKKDRKEGMHTLPVILGIKRDFKNIHLIALFLTSTVWWAMADISILWL